MAKDKVIRQLCSQAVTGFMIDAVLWWIENGDKKRDDDFFRWARQSLNTLYRQWMPDSNWRPSRREDETLEDMLPSSG